MVSNVVKSCEFFIVSKSCEFSSPPSMSISILSFITLGSSPKSSINKSNNFRASIDDILYFLFVEFIHNSFNSSTLYSGFSVLILFNKYFKL